MGILVCLTLLILPLLAYNVYSQCYLSVTVTPFILMLYLVYDINTGNNNNNNNCFILLVYLFM